MTNLVLDVKPSQLVLSKNGALKVAFFDRLCQVNVKRDDKDRIISSDEVAKLFIHIEIPAAMMFAGFLKLNSTQELTTSI